MRRFIILNKDVGDVLFDSGCDNIHDGGGAAERLPALCKVLVDLRLTLHKGIFQGPQVIKGREHLIASFLRDDWCPAYFLFTDEDELDTAALRTLYLLIHISEWVCGEDLSSLVHEQRTSVKVGLRLSLRRMCNKLWQNYGTSSWQVHGIEPAAVNELLLQSYGDALTSSIELYKRRLYDDDDGTGGGDKKRKKLPTIAVPYESFLFFGNKLVSRSMAHRGGDDDLMTGKSTPIPIMDLLVLLLRVTTELDSDADTSPYTRSLLRPKDSNEVEIKQQPVPIDGGGGDGDKDISDHHTNFSADSFVSAISEMSLGKHAVLHRRTTSSVKQNEIRTSPPADENTGNTSPVGVFGGTFENNENVVDDVTTTTTTEPTVEQPVPQRSNQTVTAKSNPWPISSPSSSSLTTATTERTVFENVVIRLEGGKRYQFRLFAQEIFPKLYFAFLSEVNRNTKPFEACKSHELGILREAVSRMKASLAESYAFLDAVSLNLSVALFQPSYPGLCHFIFVNRKNDFVYAPTVQSLVHGPHSAGANSGAQYDGIPKWSDIDDPLAQSWLQREVHRLVCRSSRALSAGFSLYVKTFGRFTYSYMLWIERGNSNNANEQVHLEGLVPPALMAHLHAPLLSDVSGYPLTSMSGNIPTEEGKRAGFMRIYPPPVTSPYYKILMGLASPTSDDVRCYELFAIWVRDAPLHSIAEYCRRMKTDLMERFIQ